MTKTILLVHGSFHTGECWGNLIPQLSERGLDARAVTLSGHGGNAKWPWLVSMKTYGSDVIAMAEAMGGSCILLGHSMGGMVISEAAERRPDLFASLIYLTAFAPKFGKHKLLDLDPPSPALSGSAKISLLKGTATVPPDVARRVFYNRCEPAMQDQAAASLCPQPIRASLGSVTTSEKGLGSVPKDYIECSDDEALPLSSQRAMQANMPFQNVLTIDSDHSPFLSKPAELADIIAQIAAR